MLQGLASSDHTTLLLNCYAKLRDTAKLDRFLRAEGPDGKPALSFDVDTAIKARPFTGAFTSVSQSASPCLCPMGSLPRALLLTPQLRRTQLSGPSAFVSQVSSVMQADQLHEVRATPAPIAWFLRFLDQMCRAAGYYTTRAVHHDPCSI